MSETYSLQTDTTAIRQNNAADTVLTANENFNIPPIQPGTLTEKPTFEEIRYWHWQREKKLLINDSRYIPSKSGNELVLQEEVQAGSIQLPNRVKSDFGYDWITFLLFLSLFMVASVRYGYAKYISTLFQSVVNYPTSHRMFGEKNYSILHGAFRLEALFYIVFSFFIFQILFSGEIPAQWDFIFYLKTFVATTAYFLVKKMLYKLLSTTFLIVEESSEFVFNLDNFNRVTGIILFPLVALFAFYPYGNPLFIIVSGIIAVVVIYILLLRRGLIILLKKQFSIFYLFLYLCILEFLPLLLIYKVVVD